VSEVVCVVGARPNFMKMAPILEALKQHAVRLAPPFDLAADILVASGVAGDKEEGTILGMGKPSKLYPEDKSWGGRLRRAFRVFPYAVDPEQAARARERLGLEGTASQRELADLEEDAERYTGDPVPDIVVREMATEKDLDKETEYGKKPSKEKLEIAAEMSRELLNSDRLYNIVSQRIGGWNDTQAQAAYEQLRSLMFARSREYKKILEGRAKRDKGGE
jgi:hypothetical protein